MRYKLLKINNTIENWLTRILLSVSADIKWCTSGSDSISGGVGGVRDSVGNESRMRGAVGNLFGVNTDNDSKIWVHLGYAYTEFTFIRVFPSLLSSQRVGSNYLYRIPSQIKKLVSLKIPGD